MLPFEGCRYTFFPNHGAGVSNFQLAIRNYRADHYLEKQYNPDLQRIFLQVKRLEH